MKVFIERDQKTQDMDFKGTVLDLLKELEIISEEVIVAVNSEIVTSDYVLKSDDDVKILSVISGG